MFCRVVLKLNSAVVRGVLWLGDDEHRVLGGFEEGAHLGLLAADHHLLDGLDDHILLRQVVLNHKNENDRRHIRGFIPHPCFFLVLRESDYLRGVGVMVQLHLNDQLHVVTYDYHRKIQTHRSHKARAIHYVRKNGELEDGSLVAGLVFTVKNWGHSVSETQVSFDAPKEQIGEYDNRRLSWFVLVGKPARSAEEEV